MEYVIKKIILVLTIIITLFSCNKKDKEKIILYQEIIKHDESFLNTTDFTYPTALNIAGGSTHSMALKSDNSLWVWGENTFGQLGVGNQTVYSQSKIVENNDSHVPVKLLENIIDIAAGDCFSLAVNSNNELLTWGKNDLGQLGNRTKLQSNIPQKIMDDVVSVSAYGNTAIAIKNDNTLWMWGADIRRHTSIPNNILPTPVLIMHNIKKAAVGLNHVIMLDNNHQVFGIGNALDLGINYREGDRKITTPDLIMSNIKDIAVSGQTSFALSHESRLYGWGANAFMHFNNTGGDAGIGSTEWWIYSPKLVSDDVKKVFSGYMFNKHDNSLWIWGSISSYYYIRTTVDNQGRRSTSLITDFNMINYGIRPVKIMDNIILASGSSGHRMAVDIDGDLYTWGNNQFGQLGNGLTSTFEINYVDYDTGEKTEPGKGDIKPTLIQSDSFLEPTKIAF
jgi:alpha-tubulin suppressor-like RCC1 family protein